MLCHAERLEVRTTVDVTSLAAACRDGVTVIRGRARAERVGLRYVEVSTDGGESWQEATLTGRNEPGRWVDWEFTWTPRREGAHTLAVRGTDGRGRRQSDHAEQGAVRHRVVVA